MDTILVIIGMHTAHKTCLACMHAKELSNMLISNNSYHEVKVTKVVATGKSGSSATNKQCTLNAIIDLASLSAARRLSITLWNVVESIQPDPSSRRPSSLVRYD